MLPICLTTFVLAGYMGGELRTPRKTQLFTTLGGSIFFYIILIIIALLIGKTVGFGFNTSAAFLSTQHASAYGFNQIPDLHLVHVRSDEQPRAAAADRHRTGHHGAVQRPAAIIWGSRILFAWSLDRIVPAPIAKVWERTASPVIAIVITVICGEIVLYLYVKGTLTYFAPIIILRSIHPCLDHRDRDPVVKKYQDVLGALRERLQARTGPGDQYPRRGVAVLLDLRVGPWDVRQPARGQHEERSSCRSGVLLFGMIYFGIVWIVPSVRGMNLSRTYAQLPPD